MTTPLWDEARIQALLAPHIERRVPLSAAEAATAEIIHDYEVDRATKANAITALQADITVQNATIAALTAEKSALQNQLATLNQAYTDLEQSSDGLIALLEAEVATLKHQIYRLTRPQADVYVTIDKSVKRTNRLDQCLFIVTNEHMWDSGKTFVARAAPHVKALYSQVAFHISAGFGLADAWAWNGTGTRPAAPHNFESLKRIATMAAQWGKDFALIPYKPSWHLIRNRDALLLATDEYAAGKGRLAGEFKAEWIRLVRDCFVQSCNVLLTAHPNARLDVLFYQEFKGMWELLDRATVIRGQNWADGANPGTPGFGDIDTVPFYKLTIEGIYQAASILKVPESRFGLGGAYAVIQSKSVRDADALPTGHPLADKEWGQMSKPPILATERFVRDVKTQGVPFNYLVIDGGTRNRDDAYHHTTPVDSFKMLNKLFEVNEYLHQMLGKEGYPGHEIVWAERYLSERPFKGATKLTAEQDAPARRIAYTLAGLCGMAWSGAGRTFQWGYRGEDGDPWLVNRENGAQLNSAGDPTPLYDMLAAFKQTFPVGCNLYPLGLEGDGVGGLGTDGKVIVFNKTLAPRTVCIGSTVHTLAAHEVKVVPA